MYLSLLNETDFFIHIILYQKRSKGILLRNESILKNPAFPKLFYFPAFLAFLCEKSHFFSYSFPTILAFPASVDTLNKKLLLGLVVGGSNSFKVLESERPSADNLK